MTRSAQNAAFALTLALTLVALAGTALAGHHEEARPDVVDVAIEAGSFETLVAAVQAAGLVEALKGDGPFTVFAPTDEAFARLPEGTVETLLRPENRDRLTEILTYHVVSGRVSAKQAAGLDQAKTLNGQEVPIDIEDGKLRVGEATVIANDVQAENGVIHVIDRVLIPQESLRMSDVGPRELIETAISKGVPLFNHGQPEACAAIYEITALSLISGFDGELSDSSRDRLRSALREARSAKSGSDQAWALRRGLDEVYGSLERSARRASSH